jgi:hypothetical protein
MLCAPVIRNEQRLQGEHFAPHLWAEGNAVGDGMPQQGRHPIVLHRIRGQVAVLHILDAARERRLREMLLCSRAPETPVAPDREGVGQLPKLEMNA